MKLISIFSFPRYPTRGWDELKMHCLKSSVWCGLRWVRRGVIERETSGRKEERMARMKEFVTVFTEFIICKWLFIYLMLVYSALEIILSYTQDHKTITITVQWLDGTPSVISLNWKHTLNEKRNKRPLKMANESGILSWSTFHPPSTAIFRRWTNIYKIRIFVKVWIFELFCCDMTYTPSRGLPSSLSLELKSLKVKYPYILMMTTAYDKLRMISSCLVLVSFVIANDRNG